MNFIEEVKSYEDICKILNLDPNLEPDVSAYDDEDKDAAVSIFRLWKANKAAWNGEVIDWNNFSQRKYEVWCDLSDEAGSGSGFSSFDYFYDHGCSFVGARLVWPSYEIGRHLVKIMEQDFINMMKIPKK
ncbi:hypothetical protein [Pedobacter gandavensis]|uniref:Phage protein n=1 Tax=Pedobacter gandavensis TaxID=2679963 RepID=A0ABR6EVE1_9SPHI|nr:hypothetical protein [Pedobacter gandavensis]MBB2149156.1 hypothetical protein [Pedobacter gandavensis]